MLNLRTTSFIALCLVAFCLGGCASWRDESVSCDGSSRRPMNVGKWDGKLDGVLDLACGGRAS